MKTTRTVRSVLVALVLVSGSPLHLRAAPVAVASRAALSEKQAIALMYQLSDGGEAETQAAIKEILSARDSRFVAVFIELMRANQIGILSRRGFKAQMAALQTLSGKNFPTDFSGYFAWIEWYGTTKLVPPPGFTTWKGKLLTRLDPALGEFLQDKFPVRLRVEEIQWGGVLVDGIPALDNARMIPAAKATYLNPGEPVFGLAINGDARAYPLRILDWHEMANDVVGGVPVSLAYCTLCGAGIAYDGRLGGTTYTFGSSGFLFRSNKLMYDRQTRTLWNQFTGEPVLGNLAAKPIKLSLLPIVLTAWKDWQTQHPDTRVLDLNTGFNRSYELGAAYGSYFASQDLMFPVWQRSQRLPGKERIYGLNFDEVQKAYPVKTLTARKVVNDTVGKTPVVLVAPRDVVTVRGKSLRDGPVSYASGGEVRAYRRDGMVFRAGPDAGTVLDPKGQPWHVTEEALLGPNGKRAPRLNGFQAYWFGWYAFFPKTQVYQP
ncbi:DUF3179 domain-containing protein [Anthocerotibacter panamensis]|uniref:DUF3179 domain-containing protein n=1 Tax=Anthocerotibacter panamensis TaxID=2857077 RepID=UPI001C40691A|nr:DUF3179 domain-containing protein [Anthocerotibacter panamensis]